MKRTAVFRMTLTFVLLFGLLSPTFALGIGDGKKHFKRGLKYEVSEEWDKACEEFALAVNENPKNPEYRLHLRRALFNASQMYMKRGTAAAEERDFAGAYNAFRRAYGFDPTNELAKSEMERMVRLQKDANSADGSKTTASGLPVKPAAYKADDVQLPQQLEVLGDVPFPAGIDLTFIIKKLAKDLDLNVLFDADSRLDSKKVKIELHNVTAARALDYIFLQEGLFFQKVGPRTILVANNSRRNILQQLVLKTFYLANASPKDVQKVIQGAIPAQGGRSQTIILTDDATNSVTVRDTTENVRIIGRLIKALDKDRAEVVMDVAIYEVNRGDLLQFGNQLGTGGDKGTLLNIGGVGFPTVHQGSTGPITDGLPFKGTDLLSIAIGLPISSIAALQSKTNTKLVASTQIHAFNNEDSSATIGQRVPVQSAQFVTGTTQGNGGVVSNVINYEKVGLSLKFKPIVFPNQDVQVAMEIESKDIGSGPDPFTPIFTERTIKGTARVQNNKTLLLASVAQNNESNGRTGLPLLGLIPILGRLFTAPKKQNTQVDIVIAVTPRVIRAPAILPEDLVEQDTGSLATPTSGQLEAMLIEEQREEMLAAARRKPTNVVIDLPDQKSPQYVRTDATAESQTPTATPPTDATASTDPKPNAAAVPETPETPMVKPIDSSVRTLKLTETADRPDNSPSAVAFKPLSAAASTASINLASAAELKSGEKTRIAVAFSSPEAFRSAVMGIKYDPTKLAVRGITLGDAFGEKANSAVMPFLNTDGKTYFSMIAADGKPVATTGVIAYIEVEALADGVPQIALDSDILNLMTADGRNIPVAVSTEGK
ncbi:MAG: hypothetical protein DYH05_01265 [Acidobacteria bacterium ACB1]|nr:hypothetical protein [Acidobacteria bacterium ACB1]